jgi:hypothetical protein
MPFPSGKGQLNMPKIHHNQGKVSPTSSLPLLDLLPKKQILPATADRSASFTTSSFLNLTTLSPNADNSKAMMKYEFLSHLQRNACRRVSPREAPCGQTGRFNCSTRAFIVKQPVTHP